MAAIVLHHGRMWPCMSAAACYNHSMNKNTEVTRKAEGTMRDYGVSRTCIGSRRRYDWGMSEKTEVKTEFLEEADLRDVVQQRVRTARQYDAVFARIMDSPKRSEAHKALLREENRLNTLSRKLNERLAGVSMDERDLCLR